MVTKSLPASSIQTTNDGIDYDADNETYVVKFNLIAFSQSGAGASSNTHINLTLINSGDIWSQLSTGVTLAYGGTNAIVNNATGEIISLGTDAIDIGGTKVSVTNLGKIISEAAAGVEFLTGSAILLQNKGYIFGTDEGVSINSHASGGEIDNFKTIVSPMIGIVVNTQSALLTTINNASGAVLSGGTNAIDAVAGKFYLSNHGVVSGTILDEANLRDVVYNFGLIKNPVFLQGGNDFFRNVGNANSGPIFGGDGNDRLIGGNHAEQLYGGDGNDTVTGGGGNDSFFFDTLPNSVSNVDTITDFVPGHDEIILDVPFFGGAGALGPLGTLSLAHFHKGAPVNHNQQIDYLPGNGFLFYDSDGKGPNAPIHFATLATHPDIHNTDFHLIFIV